MFFYKHWLPWPREALVATNGQCCMIVTHNKSSGSTRWEWQGVCRLWDCVCQYPGTGVPLVPSQTVCSGPIRGGTHIRPGANSSKREAEGSPRAKFQGQVRFKLELRSGLPTWQVFSHQKPTNSLGPKRFKTHSWWTCGPRKASMPPLSARHPYFTDRTLGGVGRQDNT
jgi:hypothetical protein